MFNISGVPETVTVAGSLTGKENEIKGLQIQDVSVSLGRVVKNIMTVLTGACIAVISIVGRKVWAGDDNKFLVKAETEDAFDVSVVINPIAGQTGTSLEWEVGSTSAIQSVAGGTFAEEFQNLFALKAPKYTVDGVVSAVARILPDGYAPYIAVNQSTSQVTIGFAPTADQEAIDTAIDGLATKPTNHAEVELEAVEETTGNSSLPFEGGVV